MEKTFAQRMHEIYDNPEVQYRPDLRWWLAEGLNTDETLRKNMQEIYDSGFGASEFLAMPEPSADSSIYGWGSDEWTSDSRLIVEEATRLGLGFSLTCGSNWANANLPDTYTWQGAPYNPDSKAAAKELDYATILLKPGEAFRDILPLPVKTSSVKGGVSKTIDSYTEYFLQGVIAARVITPRKNSGQEFAYAQGEDSGVLDISSLQDLTERATKESDASYQLDWEAPSDGTYALLVYWMHGTGQTASPSVSTNYTINYIDSYGIEALIDYWEENVLTDSLRKTIRQNGRGEIYMDSLELASYGAGGIFWGYNLKQEFLGRKGYDITLYLPLLTINGARVESHFAKKYDYYAADDAGNALAFKVRTDFYSVLTDMYLENVLRPLQKWLHSLGMTLRAEPSYGMTYEISTPAKYIDGIETESFAQVADIDLYRGILGSANMYGRPFSSETGAVRYGNYLFNMDDWTQLCYLQFAGGISRTVFHGYSAIEGSEGDTYWPGHEGMYPEFSERFNSRQPASLHFPMWTKMLARNQKVLRQGVPVRDIAILRTDYFYLNYGQPEGHDTFVNNFSMYDIPHFWNDLSLQHAGYTYDYFSPLLLEDTKNVSWSSKALQPNGPAYKAIIIYQESLELSSAKVILKIARDGLPILFVNNNTEIIAYDTKKAHRKAASVSRYLSDEDTELRAIVAEIKVLPNVEELNSPADALAALQRFDAFPRVAYDKQNNKILTISRKDITSNILYTFVYSYKFEVERNSPPYTFTLKIEGEGAPYHVCDWSGKVEALGVYEIKGGYTLVTLTMIPGESKIIALDLSCTSNLHAVFPTTARIVANDDRLSLIAEASGEYEIMLSNGEAAKVGVQVPKTIELKTWDIEVEDWNEGEKVINTEEKFGHVTTEVYFKTKKTRLSFNDSELMPWKDLPATAEQLETLAGESSSMSHVSGIGRYETKFTLPNDWNSENGAYLCIESAGGGTVLVKVNGKEAPAVNTRTLRVDISGLVKAGDNALYVEVASTLTNRMRQRGYKNRRKSGWTDDYPVIQSYGLCGDVRIVPYVIVPLK